MSWWARANFIHTGSVVTRNPAGGPVRFDENLHHCEDWDFLLRLHHLAGHRFARLNSITSVYHQVPRPGAVHSAYQAAPTPFTMARAVIYDRWPAAHGRALEYREWFRRFDHHLDTRIEARLPVPPYVYEHAVRALHATFTDRRSPDPSLLGRLLPTTSSTHIADLPMPTPWEGVVHATR
uniref:Glycosyltransferase n=1 Tax=Streptomyces sp. NBC_00049 TaxID=2903617 RepID=A0AAU2K0G5_9ACTN